MADHRVVQNLSDRLPGQRRRAAGPRGWPWLPAGLWVGVASVAVGLVGCGTTRWSDTPRTATEQLLLSDAIDQAVNRLDFAALAGQKVYFESKYLAGSVDESYIVSSLRQHLLASGCLLREAAAEADYVVEARAGAVGTDRNEFLLGSPSIPLGASIPGVPLPTSIPQVTVAKKTKQRAVAKIAVYAYERESGRPVWQSGSEPRVSFAGDTWFLGAGPFQQGTVDTGSRGSANPLGLGPMGNAPPEPLPKIDTRNEVFFTEAGRGDERLGPATEVAANASGVLTAPPPSSPRPPSAWPPSSQPPPSSRPPGAAPAGK